MIKLLTLIFAFIANAWSLSIVISPKDSMPENIELGTYFDAEIVFLPRSEISNPEEILNLFQKGQIGPFQVIRHQNLRASENNSDVIVMDAKLIQTLPATLENVVVELENQKIAIQFRNFNPSEKGIKPQRFIAEQFLDEEKANLLKLGMLVLGVLVALFLIFYIFIFNKNARNVARDYWGEANNLFNAIKNSPNDRFLYEKLYKEKNIWLQFVEQQTAKELLALIDSVQYKESWDETEVEIIRDLFSKLRLKKNV